MTNISFKKCIFKIKRFLVYLPIIYVLYRTKFEYKKNLDEVSEKYEFLIKQTNLQLNNTTKIEWESELVNFENFNNNTGLSEYIVPNVIHYVHLNLEEIKFPLFLSILSVWLNQKPKSIYFHCNLCDYKGKYWDEINRMEKLRSIIQIKKILNFNSKIFNKESGWIHHKSDVIRLLVLMACGGIYLDNDMIVINSLNRYRKFEIAVSWDSDSDGIGNQVIIANKYARLLRAMYDGYR